MDTDRSTHHEERMVILWSAVVLVAAAAVALHNMRSAIIRTKAFARPISDTKHT